MLRLLPDSYRMLLYGYYPKVDFGDEKFVVPPHQVIAIRLERSTGRMFHKRKELYVIAANLQFLNPEVEHEKLCHALLYIVEHHFRIAPTESSIMDIADDVREKYESGKLYPNGKSRTIIFNPEHNLTMLEKKRLAAPYSKRGASVKEETMYAAVSRILKKMGQSPKKLTYGAIAKQIGCSMRTVNRNMTADLRSFVRKHNDSVAEFKSIKEDLNSFADSSLG